MSNSVGNRYLKTVESAIPDRVTATFRFTSVNPATGQPINVSGDLVQGNVTITGVGVYEFVPALRGRPIYSAAGISGAGSATFARIDDTGIGTSTGNVVVRTYSQGGASNVSADHIVYGEITMQVFKEAT